MARSFFRAAHFLGLLFLCISHSAIIVRAQQVTVQGAPSGAKNATAEQVAKMLASVFDGVSNNFMAAAGVSGKGGATAAPGGAKPLNATLPPGISAMLNMTNSTMPFRVTQALTQAIAQQQASGNDLLSLENAAQTVAAFLNLPSTLGTGANIRMFQQRLDQIKSLFDQVKSYLAPSEVTTIAGLLITAQQLGLTWLAAFPLAQLAYFVALLALATAITGLLGGIFYLVGSALALAAAVGPPPAIDGTRAADASSLANQQWYISIRQSSAGLQEKVLKWAFSNSAISPLKLADGLLRTADSTLAGFESLSKQATTLLG